MKPKMATWILIYMQAKVCLEWVKSQSSASLNSAEATCPLRPVLFMSVHVIHALISTVDGGMNICSVHLGILHLESQKTTHSGY